MNSKGNLPEDARLRAKDAAQSAQPWMERLARLGYTTEGAVYALIGLLAAGRVRRECRGLCGSRFQRCGVSSWYG